MNDLLDLDCTVEDTVMIKNVLTVLARHYPNHPWAVRIDGGILEVKNQGAHGTMGFALPVKNMVGDYSKKVVLAGGELLERFRIRRGLAKPEDYALMRRNIRGDGIADM